MKFATIIATLAFAATVMAAESAPASGSATAPAATAPASGSATAPAATGPATGSVPAATGSATGPAATGPAATGSSTASTAPPQKTNGAAQTAANTVVAFAGLGLAVALGI
ncbi:hypothetical protein EMPS_02888 [Entomortierella parvispora]|uniref:Uncharacterized protein n=1 Tax=Entomortierella parvispora TaxID=205924 RepID=A0A9P3LU42_9FUNG|nr:hypothetical protein EMPS_02888 [Entomortierella parvispora]